MNSSVRVQWLDLQLAGLIRHLKELEVANSDSASSLDLDVEPGYYRVKSDH